ncbi:putative membrane protein [[Clostridium] bifermentans ATCC 638]|uniref:Putative membrane protein n=1 Tax=Paraclostridium bifermentans ATCC 638 = DSM 14991 TaxID=1233171 RepID=T4VG59_PARBF|nr:hypothetical protein [Paraclostridium bifermentans]EQK39741.1 putative membrane protein [[Clostridium] bifermentans ATCC 638] [Paraclostridium bifermentans ATCC 638 = DSM 14991]RIZ57436.1 hypothetical protein CHH45_16495 [Paraclostridium bifermentans]
MKKGIAIFLSLNVIVQSLIMFQASIDELRYQLVHQNYDILIVPIAINIISLISGSCFCGYIYKAFKGEN